MFHTVFLLCFLSLPPPPQCYLCWRHWRWWLWGPCCWCPSLLRQTSKPSRSYGHISTLPMKLMCFCWLKSSKMSMHTYCVLSFTIYSKCDLYNRECFHFLIVFLLLRQGAVYVFGGSATGVKTIPIWQVGLSWLFLLSLYWLLHWLTCLLSVASAQTISTIKLYHMIPNPVTSILSLSTLFCVTLPFPLLSYPPFLLTFKLDSSSIYDL